MGYRKYREAVKKYSKRKREINQTIDDILDVTQYNNIAFAASEGGFDSPQEFYSSVLSRLAHTPSDVGWRPPVDLVNNPSAYYQIKNSGLDLSDMKKRSAVFDLMEQYNNDNYVRCHDWDKIYAADDDVSVQVLKAKAALAKDDSLSDQEKISSMVDLNKREFESKNDYLNRFVGNTINGNNSDQVKIIEGLMSKYGYTQREATALYLDVDLMLARMEGDKAVITRNCLEQDEQGNPLRPLLQQEH